MKIPTRPHPLFSLFVILAAALLLAPGCGKPEGVAGPEVPAPAGSDAPNDARDEVLVNVTPLVRGPISSHIEVSADIESLDAVDVYPEIGGVRIAELSVDEGDRVKKGDLLATLDNEEILLELRQAEVELKEAVQQKEKATLAVDEAEERQKSAEIQQKKLHGDYQASLEIARDGLVSDKDLASDKLAWEQSMSDSALRVLEHARAELDADLAASAAEKAAIARDNAALRVRRTSIRAPIDGCISFRDATPGKTVTTTTRLFSIVDSSNLIANAYLPQEDISRIRVGMPVTFTCDADPDREFTGAADLVSPVVDPTNGTIKVRVRIEPDEGGFLRPGMFISARVLVFHRDDALLATSKAVFYEDESPCFFIVDDGMARKVLFERGAATDTVLEVLNARLAVPVLPGETETFPPETTDVVPSEATDVVPSEATPPEPAGEMCLDEDTLLVVVGQDNLKEGDRVKIVEEIR